MARSSHAAASSRSGGRRSAVLRRGVGIVTGLVLAGVLVACAPLASETGGTASPSSTASEAPAERSTPPSPAVSPRAADPAPAPSGADPAHVIIPAIGVDQPMIPLALGADGVMEVPVDYDDVGWFTGGGRPGSHGPTIIAGHVDSGWGPAVFARLSELVPGDTVEVIDVDGARFGYEVVSVEDHPRDRFPTAQVFGPTSRDELRVITCHGYDDAAAEYLDNRVVYAVRVG